MNLFQNRIIKFFRVFVLLFCMVQVFPSFSLPKNGSSSKFNKEYLNNTQQENPKLASFEKRLFDIRLEIQKIVEEYQKKQLSREKAKEKLIPLLKEQQEINNNPEYLAESMLSPGSARR